MNLSSLPLFKLQKLKKTLENSLNTYFFHSSCYTQHALILYGPCVNIQATLESVFDHNYNLYQFSLGSKELLKSIFSDIKTLLDEIRLTSSTNKNNKIIFNEKKKYIKKKYCFLFFDVHLASDWLSSSLLPWLEKHASDFFELGIHCLFTCEKQLTCILDPIFVKESFIIIEEITHAQQLLYNLWDFVERHVLKCLKESQITNNLLNYNTPIERYRLYLGLVFLHTICLGKSAYSKLLLLDNNKNNNVNKFNFSLHNEIWETPYIWTEADFKRGLQCLDHFLDSEYSNCKNINISSFSWYNLHYILEHHVYGSRLQGNVNDEQLLHKTIIRIFNSNLFDNVPKISTSLSSSFCFMGYTLKEIKNWIDQIRIIEFPAEFINVKKSIVDDHVYVSLKNDLKSIFNVFYTIKK